MSAEAFAGTVRQAQEEIARGVDQAGLRDDPYRYALAALSIALGTFPGLVEEMNRSAEAARSPLDAAAIQRIERAAVQGAAKASTQLARAHLRSTALAGVLVAVAAISGAAAAGYWWGRGQTLQQIQAVSDGLARFVSQDPDAAAGWLTIARLNDYGRVMAACTSGRGFTDPSGRRACLAPVWLEGEKPSPPPLPGRST